MGNIKRLALQLSIVSAVFVAAAGLQTLAFTEPASAPPTGNVNAPLNTGTAAQEKLGPLWINTSVSPGLPTGLLVADGNAVVGTSDSSVRTNTPRGYVSAKGYCVDGTNCVTSFSAGTYVPSGMIAFFVGACPSGWATYAAANGRYIKLSSTGTGTTDPNPHDHIYLYGPSEQAQGVQTTPIDFPYIELRPCQAP